MKQPFCMPAQALSRVLDAAAALPVPATERVPLDDACGRIAARDLCARMDQPPFDRSPLDGYALHSVDTAGAGEKTPVTLPVVMKLYAGDAPAAAALPALRVVMAAAVAYTAVYRFCTLFAMEPWLQGMNPSLYYTVSRLVQFWM